VDPSSSRQTHAPEHNLNSRIKSSRDMLLRQILSTRHIRSPGRIRAKKNRTHRVNRRITRIRGDVKHQTPPMEMLFTNFKN
jgi:hypothetical protein